MKPEEKHPFVWLMSILVGFTIGWVVAPWAVATIFLLILFFLGS